MAFFESDDLVLSNPSLLASTTELPSGYSTRSFKIDFENGRILSELADLPETVRQQAVITILTERGAHVVLGEDFGAEIQTTIAGAPTPEVATSEVDTTVRDALSIDARISEVVGVAVEHKDGDKAQIYVEIDVDGELVTVEQEV